MELYKILKLSYFQVHSRHCSYIRITCQSHTEYLFSKKFVVMAVDFVIRIDAKLDHRLRSEKSPDTINFKRLDDWSAHKWNSIS